MVYEVEIKDTYKTPYGKRYYIVHVYSLYPEEDTDVVLVFCIKCTEECAILDSWKNPGIKDGEYTLVNYNDIGTDDLDEEGFAASYVIKDFVNEFVRDNVRMNIWEHSYNTDYPPYWRVRL